MSERNPDDQPYAMAMGTGVVEMGAVGDESRGILDDDEFRVYGGRGGGPFTAGPKMVPRKWGDAGLPWGRILIGANTLVLFLLFIAVIVLMNNGGGGNGVDNNNNATMVDQTLIAASAAAAAVAADADSRQKSDSKLASILRSLRSLTQSTTRLADAAADMNAAASGSTADGALPINATANDNAALRGIWYTLTRFLDRQTSRDFRDPLRVCPEHLARDYTKVGPPVRWNKCYFFDPRGPTRDFNKAAEFCREMSGRVVSPESKKEAEFLSQVVENNADGFWIGATQSNPPSDGTWRWNGSIPGVEDDALDNQVILRVPWYPQERFGGSCAYYSVSTGFWRSGTCWESRRIVCETLSTNKVKEDDDDADAQDEGRVDDEFSIDDGDRLCNRLGAACFWLSRRPASWTMSRDACTSLGGRLVEPRSAARNTELINVLDGAGGALWIGGRRENSADGWRWNTGDAAMNEGYTDWKAAPPDLENLCLAAEVVIRNATHFWTTRPCYQWNRFVCELKPASGWPPAPPDDFISSPVCVRPQPPSTPAVGNETAAVPAVAEERCFRFVRTQLPRAEAEEFCKRRWPRPAEGLSTTGLADPNVVGNHSSSFAEAARRLLDLPNVWMTALDPTGPDVTKLPKVSADVTLVGGPNVFEGNVMMSGQPVCDDYWDMNDVKVVCREFGLEARAVTTGSKYGSVHAFFRMDNVRCTGEEAKLSSCRHDSDDDCGESEGAGAVCVPPMRRSGFVVSGLGKPLGPVATTSIEFKGFYDAEWGWFVCEVDS